MPLLSPVRHACPEDATAAQSQVCAAYDYKVTCASCHSAPKKAAPTSFARRLLGFLETAGL